jgi:hypothetical protein
MGFVSCKCRKLVQEWKLEEVSQEQFAELCLLGKGCLGECQIVLHYRFSRSKLSESFEELLLCIEGRHCLGQLEVIEE